MTKKKKKDNNELSPCTQAVILIVLCIFIALVIMWLGQ